MHFLTDCGVDAEDFMNIAKFVARLDTQEGVSAHTNLQLLVVHISSLTDCL